MFSLRLFICIVLTLSAISVSAKTHYWLAEVTEAKTVYEPSAEYQYEVIPLQPLVGDESTFVSSFSIPFVISHSAVLPGSWVIIRVNLDHQTLSIVEAQSKTVGFGESQVFNELFLSRLRSAFEEVRGDLIQIYRPKIAHFKYAIDANEAVEVRYSDKNDTLLLTAIEYYSHQIIKDFTPYIREKVIWGFKADASSSPVRLYRESPRKSPGKLFNQSLDVEQALPSESVLREIVYDR